MHTLGDLKKITGCRVKPYELVNTDNETHNTKEVMKEDGLEDINNLHTTGLNSYYYNNKHTNKHLNTVGEITHNVKYTNTNSTEETIWYDACKNLDDGTNAQTLTTSKYTSFEDACTYTVELAISEHWRPEVKVAKKAEIKNLKDYETFMEVKDEGQTKVGSRWVITEKEQHDGQKTKVKARLVV